MAEIRGNRHCCYGQCKSDQRYPERNGGAIFFPFPKPRTRLEDCKMWIKACGRPHDQLNPDVITKNYYVCSKHFVDGRPTEKYPYPTPYDGQPVRRGRKRKNTERPHNYPPPPSLKSTATKSASVSTPPPSGSPEAVTPSPSSRPPSQRSQRDRDPASSSPSSPAAPQDKDNPDWIPTVAMGPHRSAKSADFSRSKGAVARNRKQKTTASVPTISDQTVVSTPRKRKTTASVPTISDQTVVSTPSHVSVLPKVPRTKSKDSSRQGPIVPQLSALPEDPSDKDSSLPGQTVSFSPDGSLPGQTVPFSPFLLKGSSPPSSQTVTVLSVLRNEPSSMNGLPPSQMLTFTPLLPADPNSRASALPAPVCPTPGQVILLPNDPSNKRPVEMVSCVSMEAELSSTHDSGRSVFIGEQFARWEELRKSLGLIDHCAMANFLLNHFFATVHFYGLSKSTAVNSARPPDVAHRSSPSHLHSPEPSEETSTDFQVKMEIDVADTDFVPSQCSSDERPETLGHMGAQDFDHSQGVEGSAWEMEKEGCEKKTADRQNLRSNFSGQQTFPSLDIKIKTEPAFPSYPASAMDSGTYDKHSISRSVQNLPLESESPASKSGTTQCHTISKDPTDQEEQQNSVTVKREKVDEGYCENIKSVTISKDTADQEEQQNSVTVKREKVDEGYCENIKSVKKEEKDLFGYFN